MKRLVATLILMMMTSAAFPITIAAQVSDEDVDQALAVAEGNAEVAELLDGRQYIIADIKLYVYSGPQFSKSTVPPPPPVPTGEIEITLVFTERFQFRGHEVAQLMVFVNSSITKVVGYYLIDSGIDKLPIMGRVALTEFQEQRGLDLALADPLVAAFLDGKPYDIARMDGMLPRSGGEDTGRPGVFITFTFNKEYKFKGDIYNPPYRDEKTYYLEGTVKGLEVMVNLETGKIVHMYPNVTSIPIPLSQWLMYAGIIATGLLIGAGVYYWLRRAGYREDSQV
ncbi:MAG: hypothetical protein P3T54_05650 [Dehalogenimonas sp.]|uniref:Transmembrane protein n=1 Tax=Candidatus Dehalogenimonas loeffleri TaxID=3127115 RepID=A0ABZ2J4P8_9CHLR|nr:hypothetical protein [Dehalogenimonas sp.]